MTIEGSILALDVGAGTQDLLIWEPGQPAENAVKMVLPAPTQMLARRVRRITAQGRPLFLTGRVMGGGAITQAVRSHLGQGLPVFATPQAALTFHDRLDAVQQWGIILRGEAPPGTVTLMLADVDPEWWRHTLAVCEVPFPRHFAVAVQDHGFSPEISNRRFRFQHWEAFLAGGGRLADLAYREPPAYLTRMQAVAQALPGALLMDTCAAGVRGALLDSRILQRQTEGLMVVNAGNAHTFAALVRGDRIWGIYEHHTGLLQPAQLEAHLARFQAGELTNDEVFQDDGHGCAYAPDYPAGNPFTLTVVTGPRRRLARDWPGAVFAAPFGDMMLTGCFGLIMALVEKKNFSVSLEESV